MREPIFGPNAKPFFLQIAGGVIVYLAVTQLFGDWIYRTASEAFCSIFGLC